MTYAEQIKNPKWQKKRLEVLEAHDFKCEECGNKDEQLDVHHPYYKKGAKIWEYEESELKCFCHTCHEKAHKIDAELKKSMALIGINEMLQVLGYVDSMICASNIRMDNEHYQHGFMDQVRTNDGWLVHMHDYFQNRR